MQSTSLQQSPPAPAPAPAAAYASPKRKRVLDSEDIDMVDVARSPLRLRTDVSAMEPRAGPAGDSSPRTAMSSQMESLDIQQEYHPIPLSFRNKTSGNTNPKLPAAIGTQKPRLPPLSLPESSRAIDQTVMEPPRIRLGPSSPSRNGPSAPPSSLANPFDPPETPTLKPAPSPLEAPRIISPLPGHTSVLPHPFFSSSSLLPPSDPTPTIAPSSPTPQPALTPSSVLSGGAAASKRPKSPPPPADSSQLSPTMSDLVWTDAEITGTDPDDPQDDGYGINGIGFRPTPAVAHARHMRRKQQVADWRSREAKEARSRRAERRRGVGTGSGGMQTGSGGGSGSGVVTAPIAREGKGGGGVGGEADDGTRRVRFIEG